MQGSRLAPFHVLTILSLLAGDADPEGEWRTINGSHVLIDPQTGEIIKGPRGLMGTKPDSPKPTTSKPNTEHGGEQRKQSQEAKQGTKTPTQDPGLRQRIPDAGGTFDIKLPDRSIQVQVRDEKASERLTNLFGDKATPENLARLLGAPDGAKVEYFNNRHLLYAEVKHPHFEEFRRIIVRREDGTMELIHSDLRKAEGAPAGVALPVVRDVVAFAPEMGIDQIGMFAAGSVLDDPSEKRYNGAYTWATYGFGADNNLEDVVSEEAAEEAREKFGVETLGDLMEAEGGREWWRRNYNSFFGSFDLDNPQARRILNARLREKGLKEV